MRHVFTGCCCALLLTFGLSASARADPALVLGFEKGAQEYVANELSAKGIDVATTQIKLQSLEGVKLRRSGTVLVSWEVDQPHGVSLKGVAKMKGSFGRVLGFGMALGEELFIRSASPPAEALMQKNRDRIDARNKARPAITDALNKSVSLGLAQLGYSLGDHRVKSQRRITRLDDATLLFKNKVQTPEGTHVVTGSAHADITWHDGKIRSVTPRPAQIDKDRRTAWTALTHPFRRGGSGSKTGVAPSKTGVAPR